jgi:IS1 family transposase
MNQLPLAKRVQIINLLVEGMSMRATSRVTGCSINTVTKLFVDVGKSCLKFHDETVVGIQSKRIQCDEIWSFVYSKEKNTPGGSENFGDVWTWVAMDPDSKLVISWFVGDRSGESAKLFLGDLHSRLSGRVQLTSDGYGGYEDAVVDTFIGTVDYGRLVKIYEDSKKKGSYGRYKGATRVPVIGEPNPIFITTSHIERQNLTMRMHMRRFTRKTNAFSKKKENHCYALALHFVYYNFCRIHSSIRVTPAMEAGLTKEVMEIEEIVGMLK